MLRTGILIAGSLYWNDQPHRVRWRENRLRKGSEISVRVPLRYGRRSRAGSYTMVFAPGCQPGQGKILDCVHGNDTIDDIIREAQALWLAESPDGSRRKPTETLASDWGCVALLANPASDLPKSLFEAWAARVAQEKHHTTQPCYDSRAYAVKERAAMSDGGLLQIEWPVRADTGAAVDSLDLLLATATRPTPIEGTGDYPTARQVADAWLGTKDPQYFLENRRHGFRTFQDKEISAHLRAGGIHDHEAAGEFAR
jgi:hypothetical protein